MLWIWTDKNWLHSYVQLMKIQYIFFILYITPTKRFKSGWFGGGGPTCHRWVLVSLPCEVFAVYQAALYAFVYPSLSSDAGPTQVFFFVAQWHMYITWDGVEVWTGETPVSLVITPFHTLFYWQDTSFFSKMEWSSKELFCGAILPFNEVKVTGYTGQGVLGFLDFHRGLWRSSAKQLEPSRTLCTLNVLPNVFSSLFQLVTWGQNLVSALTCRHYQLLSLPQSRDEGHLIFSASLKIEAAVGSARVKPAFLLQSALCRVRLA